MENNNSKVEPIEYAIKILEECAPGLDISYLQDLLMSSNEKTKAKQHSAYWLISQTYIQALVDTNQVDKCCLEDFNKEYPRDIVEKNTHGKDEKERTVRVVLDAMTWRGIDNICIGMKEDSSCLHAKSLEDAVHHMLSLWADAGRRPGSWENGVFTALGLMPNTEEFKIPREDWSDQTSN